MFFGAEIFNIFNTISVFPITGICHLSGISGSVTGLAMHVRACAEFFIWWTSWLHRGSIILKHCIVQLMHTNY